MTILAFGDSNTHGTVALSRPGQLDRLPPGSRWPDVAARLTGLDVVVEGQPGRTTVHDDPIDGAHKNGLRVLPALLETHRPIDRVVIMLGTNDCKARFGLRGWDIAAGAVRLAHLVRASDAGPQGRPPGLLLIAPVPLEETGILAEAFQGGRARARAVAPALEAEAARLQWPFLDAGRHAAVDPVDGVHLTAEGHLALGRAVADVLSGLDAAA
ncbi:GDSL-type esterase/lipase family protein [Jannaschia sp. LMIT008]|uniref:GDSL-type esterase/lipase family protein n=1 Tax=Jannaschia maritima TaxID=3032585 RepID=UPI00281143CF|nr:GDSL-type esterase/lipase family protein [Jannaschia sp. LMIT008]